MEGVFKFCYVFAQREGNTGSLLSAVALRIYVGHPGRGLLKMLQSQNPLGASGLCVNAWMEVSKQRSESRNSRRTNI